jgi:hypothetical protein
VSEVGEGVRNREVPRSAIPAARGDGGGACGRACLEEEGGPRGNPGFPRATEPQAEAELA